MTNPTEPGEGLKAANRIADLQLALKWALGELIRYEPGDSRAVSNEFVSAACIEADLADSDNDDARRILTQAIEVQRPNTPGEVKAIEAQGRLTPEYLAMTPLQKWETLVLHGLLGTDEPWIEDMRETLRSLHTSTVIE